MQAEGPRAARRTPREREPFPCAGRRLLWLLLPLAVSCTHEDAVQDELDEVVRARLEVAAAWELEGVETPEEDDALHALLARAYAGEALTQAYVDHHRALTRFSREAVEVRVEAVEVEETLLEDGARGAVGSARSAERTGRLRWRTRAEVRHAGHAHLRENRVEARLTWVRTADGPRIVAEQVLRAQRVPLVAGAGEAGGRALRELLEEPVRDGVDTASPGSEAAP